MGNKSVITLTNDPDLGWSPGHIHMPVPVGDISDGHYTYNELYAKIKELQLRLESMEVLGRLGQKLEVVLQTHCDLYEVVKITRPENRDVVQVQLAPCDWQPYVAHLPKPEV